MKLLRVLSCCLLLITYTVIKAQKDVNENGYNILYYPNGKISSEGNMKNGKPDGFWKTYYPSGIIKSEGNRKNHLLDSIWVFYNETGDTLQKINYVIGKRNGFSIVYNTDKTSDPMERGKIILRELYINDKREGVSYSYFNNGRIKEEIRYSDNKRNGICKEYSEDGMLITILNYKNGFLTDREKINRKDEKGLKQGIWRTFYDNDRIKTEASYVNDLLNGTLKEYDENGNIKVLLQYSQGAIIKDKDTTAMDVEIRYKYDDQGNMVYSGSYRDSIPIGIHRMYDNKGNVINSYLFDNYGNKTGEGIISNEGKKQGDWKYFYNNGSIKSQGKYTNNMETGTWKFFFINGKTEQIGTFKNGKTDGLWQWYYKNGDIKREEEFYEGKAEGNFIEYDTLGQVIVSGKYFDGQKEEDWLYKIGDVTEKGKFKGDLKDGLWQSFYSDGKLRYEGHFIQGNPDGEHRFYFPNGQIKETNYYLMGISEKNWRKYDENGVLLLTITYKDNKEYKINGEKIEFADNDIKLIQ